MDIANRNVDDYTLFFTEYNFDWNRPGDWDSISELSDSHSHSDTHSDSDSKSKSTFRACTFPISAIGKKVCVENKKGGGFKVNFRSETEMEDLAPFRSHEDNYADYYDALQLDSAHDADSLQAEQHGTNLCH